VSKVYFLSSYKSFLSFLSFLSFFQMSSVYSFPVYSVLFGESSLGKRKMWSVSVSERDGAGVITVTHGYEGGKKVVNDRVVTAGKNLGKKNATTPVTQAISEAESLWNKKRDAGYATETTTVATVIPTVIPTVAATVIIIPTVAAIVSATVTTVPASVPLPMLAQDYNKRGKSMTFPCFAQRKLDGVRCVAIAGRGLFSRNGKASSPHLTHIVAEMNLLPAGTTLDGELYSDDLTFQEIVGLVKKGTLKAGDAEKMAKIHLCVYDTIRDGTNTDRNVWLQTLFTSYSFSAIRLLPTVACASLADIKTLHAEYVAEGYEGLILRNATGLYKVGHRSTDLQKYKEFMDSEYPVISFKEGDGVEKGCVIWVCRTPKGQEFAVRPRGTHEERIEAFKAGASRIGNLLTVRYQELTTDGIPRFPVGIAFRDYE
jgi:ATP-dependent DNA ligase